MPYDLLGPIYRPLTMDIGNTEDQLHESCSFNYYAVFRKSLSRNQILLDKPKLDVNFSF